MKIIMSLIVSVMLAGFVTACKTDLPTSDKQQTAGVSKVESVKVTPSIPDTEATIYITVKGRRDNSTITVSFNGLISPGVYTSYTTRTPVYYDADGNPVYAYYRAPSAQYEVCATVSNTDGFTDFKFTRVGLNTKYYGSITLLYGPWMIC
jgi:hypothetical protein